ncbi:MAG: hypothetical protein Q9201_001013 [Fulgogasparrea decipioides]
MSDAEGDTKMVSSSEGSEDDLDAMFPDANEPPGIADTPELTHSHNVQQFSELSPPTSQDPTDSRNLETDLIDFANGGEGSSTSAMYGNDSAVDVSQKNLPIADREPGASWNNRKQQDEEERAKEHIVDKSFSLR